MSRVRLLWAPAHKALVTRIARHKRRLQGLAAFSLLCLGLSLLAAYLLPLPARLALADSTLVTYRDGHPAHVFLSEDDKWRIGISVDEIDAAYLDALIALEDQRFYQHLGVDPIAVGRALLSNIGAGRVVSGASTITMQLVRMVEPRPRTLRSKVIESLRAAQLELRLSKDEILSHYLRFVPYGRNIEGVDAAALAYFGHRADTLSPEEIATLLAVPQAPNQRYPHPKHVERLRRARAQISQELLALGKLPLGMRAGTMEQAHALLNAQPVPDRLRPFPRQLAHLSYWLKQREPKRARFSTSLDRATQHVVERMMSERRSELVASQIHNGAAVVIDHRTRQVRAVVGNFNFDDSRHGGQLPGFALPRSTGSLLKPFLLGMAIDQGLAHPGQLTVDVPMARGGYRPENFDGAFFGLVRFEEALVRSLNLPFVALAEQLGVDTILGVLRGVGLEHLNPKPDHYGLSVAIGGVEATVMEIGALYASLAVDGSYRPLELESTLKQAQTLPLLSPEAAYLIRQTLATRVRPDLPHRAKLEGISAKIHWKTGTSNGLRDAWSAGSGQDYTAVVWLGNFSNASSPMLIGGQAAAPLMFDILEALERPAAHQQELRPAELKEIKVCAYSGFIAGPACEKTQPAYAPRRAVPSAPCPYHQHILVDAQTGLRLTPACAAGREVIKRAIVQWPAPVERWMIEQRRQLPALPEWAPGCSPYVSEAAPRITQPAQNQSILLIPNMPTSSQRVPLTASSLSHNPLSWFVDGEFIGTTAPGEQLLWEPVLGEHDVVVMDESGRASRRILKVSQPGG